MTREIPRLSGGGTRFGHLMELRHDPIGLFQRVRRECGELGIFRMLDRDVALLLGPRGAGAVLPADGRGLRSAAHLERADAADLRARRRVRRAAREAARHDEVAGAPRQEPARLGRGDRARDRAHGEDARRRGRDRSARLHRRAHHLHVERDADRPGLPRRAHARVLAEVLRARGRHRRDRLPQLARGHRGLPRARPRARAPRRAGRGRDRGAPRSWPSRRRTCSASCSR